MSGAQHAALRLESALGNAGWMRQLRALYGTAFPSEERVPFFYLLRKAKKGAAECLAALDGDRFVGLAYTVSHKDLVFLFYFAVSDDRRGAGYGTAVLEALGHRYSGKRMVLSIEALEEASPNIEQRRRRKAFYLHCGFQEAGFTMREQGVAYEILCRGGAVPFEDYRAMLQSYMGKLLYALFYRRIRP